VPAWIVSVIVNLATVQWHIVKNVNAAMHRAEERIKNIIKLV